MGRVDGAHRVKGSGGGGCLIASGIRPVSAPPPITPLAPDVVERVVARDYSLWPEPAPGDGGDWLGWLDLPGQLRESIAELSAAAAESEKSSVGDAGNVVVLGMGGSSLTSAVFAHLFQSENGDTPTKRLSVLDTVNPRTINEFIATTDIEDCHFIVASKSGTTAEPLALEAIFRDKLQSRGIDPVPRFTAISDAGTPLAVRAESGQFLQHIATPANVGGRFSALTAFGIYPALLCDMLDEDMITSATLLAEHYQSESNWNVAYSLADRLVDNAALGRDKLTVATSASLQPLGMWLEQLVAESTGKLGGGLVPVAGESSADDAPAGNDRQVITIRLKDDPEVASPVSGAPIDTMTLRNRSAITGHFFLWELAVAMASSGLGVYPFDQPNVEAAKQFTLQVLESDSQPEIVPVTLADAITSACNDAAPGRYVALCAFLPESDSLTNAFAELRAAISKRTRMATTLGYGPRYLHSTGQIHKGGSDSIIQVVIAQDDSDFDIAVPGNDYTLAQLSRSQAVGDVMAMRELGRQSLFVEVGQDAVSEVNAAIAHLSG